MFSSSGLTAWNLLTATAALLAFLIGLMGLVGRERKSPYVVNSVIAIFLVCLVGAAIDLLSTALPCPYDQVAIGIGLSALILAFLISIYRTYKILTRLHYFVDHLTWKNFPIIRDIRRWSSARRIKPTYEHNALNFPEPVRKALDVFSKELNAEARVDLVRAQSICVRAKYARQMDSGLHKLALECLKNNVTVQYLSGSRHPIEFVSSLKDYSDKSQIEFQPLSSKIIAIDAFSPHYAFLDSIYPKKTLQMSALGVAVVTAKMSYAGVHTAASRAFNLLKSRGGNENRLPTLVIYEDLFGLSDLESPEQYHIFIRHVLPSERQFGGMLTVFVEAALPDAEWELLQAQGDVVVDMKGGAKPAPKELS